MVTSVVTDIQRADYEGDRAALKRLHAQLTPFLGDRELLMNLAFANLNRATPDLPAAERYAQDALALVPYWHYVRDILLPQIRKAKSKI